MEHVYGIGTEILDDVKRMGYNFKKQDHGNTKDNFNLMADMLRSYLETYCFEEDAFDARDVVHIMALLEASGIRMDATDVIFTDGWRNNIIHQYTAQEFLALTEMPPLPDDIDEKPFPKGWDWDSLKDA